MNTKTVLQIVAVVVGLVLLTGYWHWPVVKAGMIREDLHDYARAVRRSHRSLYDKWKLLDRIEAIEDRLDQGETVNIFKWQSTDEAIRDMLRYTISDDEVALIKRELQRVERTMTE